MKTILNDLRIALIERARAMLTEDKGFFDTALRAYNRYQEDERDGVDYIFDISNTEDVKCCFDGGLSVEHLVNEYNKKTNSGWTEYFHYGINYEEPYFYICEQQLVDHLTLHMKFVVKAMLIHPKVKEYSDLFEKLVSNYITE